MQAAGFAKGVIIYLDIETGGSVAEKYSGLLH
jgi:hypothetical protein